MDKRTSGRPLRGVLFGLLSGAALGGLGYLAFYRMNLSASLPVCLFALALPVVISSFWAWGGWPCALAAALSNFAAVLLLLGPAAAAVFFAALILPGLLTAFLVKRRMRFYAGVRASMLIQLGAFLLLLFGAWLMIRGDLIDALLQPMREVFDQIPGELLGYLGQAGFFGADTGIDFARALDAAQRSDLLNALFGNISLLLKQNMPSTVLTTGIVVGGLSYALCARQLVRSGAEPPVDFVPVGEWRLTPSMIVGLPASTLISLILFNMGVRGADALYVAVLNLMFLAFTVQCAGALSRRLKQAGVTPGKRCALILLVTLLVPYLGRFLGIYSALLGSQGLITNYLKKRAEKRDKGDE